MEFALEAALPVLRRTPRVIRGLLEELPPAWIDANEGDGTWSPYDVVGHLIHGERTVWMRRVEHLLAHGERVPLPSFDRLVQAETQPESQPEPSRLRPLLHDLLVELDVLRAGSLARLEAIALTSADLERRGLHPDLGSVTLAQLLATWVAHDLSHIGQIVRVMARQYGDAVGPWRLYLPLLGRG